MLWSLSVGYTINKLLTTKRYWKVHNHFIIALKTSLRDHEFDLNELVRTSTLIWKLLKYLAHYFYTFLTSHTGMSFGQLLIGAYGSISYNVVIMYSFYYMFASFTKTLPWIGCNHAFNTPYCTGLVQDCLDAGGIITLNTSCVPLQSLSDDDLDFYNVTYDGYGMVNDTDSYNLSSYRDPFSEDRVTPSEEYWRYVWHASSIIKRPVFRVKIFAPRLFRFQISRP